MVAFLNVLSGTFDSLVRYLHIARKSKGPSSFVDTELVFALAKTNCLDELKEFISKVHKAELQQVSLRDSNLLCCL